MLLKLQHFIPKADLGAINSGTLTGERKWGAGGRMNLSPGEVGYGRHLSSKLLQIMTGAIHERRAAPKRDFYLMTKSKCKKRHQQKK